MHAASVHHLFGLWFVSYKILKKQSPFEKAKLYWFSNN